MGRELDPIEKDRLLTAQKQALGPICVCTWVTCYLAPFGRHIRGKSWAHDISKVRLLLQVVCQDVS